MEFLEYLLLGVIQGLTEFLPVSSSGHLVLAEHWLGLNPPGVVLEIAVHVATLISVVIVYFREILQLWRERNWHYLLCIIIATAVTVVIALPFKQQVTELTDSPIAVRYIGVALLITAAWLLVADWRLRRPHKNRPLSWGVSVLIGIAQAIAVSPGISRSGATIGTAILAGQPRTEAARFSFLLSIPVILGAALLSLGDLRQDLSTGHIHAEYLALAFVAALLTGIVAIRLVVLALRRARLSWFALYCIALGIAAIIIG